ncbi:MAG: hypothetical protein WC505_04425 [Patescibacteria group bacterium]
MTKENTRNIIKRLDVLEARIAKLEHSPVPVTPPRTSKKLSLREFLLSKKPTDAVKQTLVIGYYLEKYEGIGVFTITDLEAAFEHAKETKPLNLNDKVNMNIRNGHFEEASEKKDSHKAWYLTNSGEQFVEKSLETK